MKTRLLVLLVLSAGLAFSFSACCCNDSDAWQKKLEEEMGNTVDDGDKADDGDEADDGDKADKDDDGDKADKDDDGDKGDSKGSGKLADMDADHIIKVAKDEGWKKVAKPSVNDAGGVKTTVITVIKGTKGGSIMLYKAKMDVTLEALEKGFAKQDAASVRDGKYLLAVIIPGHKSDAQALLKALTK